MVITGRPTVCRTCGSTQIRQLYPERLDIDGDVIVGTVECEHGHGYIYAKAAKAAKASAVTQGVLSFEGEVGREPR